MEEIWKDIDGYEGKYQVSNLGRVKSLYFKNISSFIKREKILKPGLNKQKYLILTLSQNNIKSTSLRVHRLVAKAFLPNPNNFPQVNHIDGNKQNNCVDNLEWCTNQYNVKQSFANKQQLPTWLNKKGKDNPLSRKVIQCDSNYNHIKIWNGMREVQDRLGIYAASISKCCKGKQHTAGGYKWKYY